MHINLYMGHFVYLNDSLNILVNLLSLKGIWLVVKLLNLNFLFSFASAAMQFPKALMDLLIFFASSNRTPSENDLERRSLPAKSTMVNNAFLWNFFWK